MNKDDSDSEDERENEDYSVKIIENNIYFYGEVSWASVLELNIAIKKLNGSATARTSNNINLFIHSDGGCLMAGLSGMDHIINSKVHITTIVDGFAASAASMLLLGGHTRKMMKHAIVLIHQLSTGLWGKYEELKDEIKNCDLLMKNAIEIYKEYTEIPEKRLNRLMKKDIYLNFNKCIKYKIVDEVFTGN